MNRPVKFIAVTGLSLAGFLSVSALAADKPDAAKPEPHKHVTQVYGDFNWMKSLTEEQREKIHKIQEGYAEKVKALRAQERAEIMPLLDDKQKEELKALDEKQIEKENAAKAKAEAEKKAEAEHKK